VKEGISPVREKWRVYIAWGAFPSKDWKALNMTFFESKSERSEPPTGASQREPV